MDNARHTPGPWVCRPDDPGYTTAMRYVVTALVGGCSDAVLADVGHDTPWRSVEANARLIAAAPDLLAALRAIEATLDGRQPVDVPGAVMVARTAIARAEGR